MDIMPLKHFLFELRILDISDIVAHVFYLQNKRSLEEKEKCNIQSSIPTVPVKFNLHVRVSIAL